MTHTLCVIPARGGSKGIPRKNVREVGGRPLIVWTIAQALDAQPPAGDTLEVVVSTEDAEIADVARAAGATVVDRPDDLGRDETPTEPVIEHAIEARTAAGVRPDQVLLLQATSPVRLPGTLDRALAEFDDATVDSMVGVVPQAPFLWWQATPGAGPRADYDVAHRRRRQDLTEAELRYRETGSLYLTRTEIYLETHNRLGGRIRLFVMSEEEGADLDTPLDVEMLEGRWRGGPR